MEYIYDQAARGVAEHPFGRSNVRHGGCGAVATYNALLTLGREKDLETIIREYRSRHSLCLFGWLGMSFWSIAAYFRRAGYDVRICVNPGKFDEMIRTWNAGVVWYLWWDGKHKRHPLGAHFVHTARKDASFYFYNLRHGQTDTIKAESLRAVLKKEAVCAVLLCIREKH